MQHLHSVLCGSAFVSLAASYASATILVGNLDQVRRDASPVGNPEFWCAQSFVVDPQSRPLSWIEAIVGDGFGSPSVVAELRSADAKGNIDQSPAGLLTTFIAPDMSGPESARLFSPVTPVTLSASTKYWFILGCDNTGGYDWAYVETHGQTGPGAITDFADSSTAGTEWIYRGSDFPYFLQVNVNETGLEWNLDGDGDWSVADNWLGGPPNAFGSQANFGFVITADRAVTVDLPKTVGQINFNNNNASYTLAGPGTITLDGVSGLINVASGDHTINAPLQLAVDTEIRVAAPSRTLTLGDLQDATVAISKVGPGNVQLNRVRTTAALNVNAGTVTVIANGTDAGASRVETLSIVGGSAAPGAALDLNDNDLIVATATYADIADTIAHARNGGAWDRRGITSSAARDATPGNTTLGVLSGVDFLSLGQTEFDGFTVSAGDVLVKYTYYGDTDFNGVVNFDDYARIDNGFNSGGDTWFEGDFDLNGVVNFDDYSLIDLAFNTQTGPLAASAVPEPSCALAAIAVLPLARRRRR